MPEINGTKVDWLVLDHLRVQVALSTDEAAKAINNGKHEPIMFKDVNAGGQILPFAFSVDKGSALEFRIHYRGRWGFGYRIVTGTQEIVSSLFHCAEKEFDETHTTIQRYQHSPRTIQAQDWATLEAGTKAQAAAEWVLDITAWEILGFMKNGRRYGTPSRPGTVSSGATIKTKNKNSTHQIHENSLSDAIGSASAGASFSAQVVGGGLTEGHETSSAFSRVTRLNHQGPDSGKLGYMRIFVFINK